MNGVIFPGLESKHILGLLPTRWGATRVTTLCKWPKFNVFHWFKKNHHFFTPPFTTGPGSGPFFPLEPFDLCQGEAEICEVLSITFFCWIAMGPKRCATFTRTLHDPPRTERRLELQVFPSVVFFTPALAIGVDTSEVGVGKIADFYIFMPGGVAKDVAVPGLRITFDFKKLFWMDTFTFGYNFFTPLKANMSHGKLMLGR